MRAFAEKAAEANGYMVKAYNAMYFCEETLENDPELRAVVVSIQYAQWGELLNRLPIAPAGALSIPPGIESAA